MDGSLPHRQEPGYTIQLNSFKTFSWPKWRRLKGEIKLSTSRRGFLKKSVIVGAGAALQAIPGLASPFNGF